MEEESLRSQSRGADAESATGRPDAAAPILAERNTDWAGLDPARIRNRGRRLLQKLYRRKSWPIRTQMYFGSLVLLVIIFILATAGIQAVLKFRSLTKIIRDRATELPLSAKLSQEVSDLRVSYAKIEALLRQPDGFGSYQGHPTRDDILYANYEFRDNLLRVRGTLSDYEYQLQSVGPNKFSIADVSPEAQVTRELHVLLDEIESSRLDSAEVVFSELHEDQLSNRLDQLQTKVQLLPTFMKQRMDEFAENARANYHAWLAFSVILFCVAVILIASLAVHFRKWIFKPLQALIAGSREVAAGNYNYRIRLNTEDEMAELANALNEMTSGFQAIRRDLNNQVRQRTREVVRSEQMASVGFLAAGVAHEINNPLAAIAWSAESLEMRIEGILELARAESGTGAEGRGRDAGIAGSTGGFPRLAIPEEPSDAECEAASELAASDLAVADPGSSGQLDASPADADSRWQQDVDEIKKYLRRIQDEAFRCKGITGSLLDFSRLGDASRQPTDLVELVQGVIDMVRPLSKYRRRNIRFAHDPVVQVDAIAHEIKQVVLNLLTNALDSVAEQGNVEISLRACEQWATLRVKDDGCGMTEEVRRHLFEPFFTRRADGRGTGLGLSITYRIIDEHGGSIEPRSDGPGQGSLFEVKLALAEPADRNQSAA